MPTVVDNSEISALTDSENEVIDGDDEHTNIGDAAKIRQLKNQLKRYVVKYLFWIYRPPMPPTSEKMISTMLTNIIRYHPYIFPRNPLVS